MADLLTKKEVRKILKENPHKWTWDEFGMDLICYAGKTNMEGMNDTCVEVPAEYLSEEGIKDRKKYGFEPHMSGNIKMYYAPKSWFKETVIFEQEQVAPNHWVHCFGPDKNSPDTTTWYNIPDNAKLIKCPHCAELRKVFSHCYRNWPLWVKIVSFFWDRIRSSNFYINYRLKRNTKK